MRVKDCKGSNCSHCVRRVWSHEYEPKNYHTIGMSHAYAYCDLHNKRVSEVKDCSHYLKLNGQLSLFDDEERCPGYCDVTCVDGSCPMANKDEYAERGYDVTHDCSECGYYKGCEDCAFDGTEMCARRNDNG